MTTSSEDLEHRKERNTGAHLVLGGLAVAALIGLVVFLLLGNLLEETTEQGLETPEADRPDVSQEAYAAVETGGTKEDVLSALEPAIPVDTRVLSESQLREPETPSSECVYYESAGGLADDLYRFCFVDDELVDKTVILPDQPGVDG